MKAIELIFKYLPRSYDNAEDEVAREKVHNASCIAGMAFTNAFLGNKPLPLPTSWAENSIFPMEEQMPYYFPMLSSTTHRYPPSS